MLYRKEVVEMLVSIQNLIIYDAREAIADLERIPIDSDEFERKVKIRLQHIENELQAHLDIHQSQTNVILNVPIINPKETSEEE
jgi:hypothetical protein